MHFTNQSLKVYWLKSHWSSMLNFTNCLMLLWHWKQHEHTELNTYTTITHSSLPEGGQVHGCSHSRWNPSMRGEERRTPVDSDSLFTQFYNKCLESSKHTNINKQQQWPTSTSIVRGIHPSTPPKQHTPRHPHTCTHTHTHACMHARTHTHARTHAHTHTHTHIHYK